MSSVSIAVKLWAKTVTMNAILFGIPALAVGEFKRAAIALILLIGGFIITLPWLVFIILIVKASTWLPYSNSAKIGWLTFGLTVLIIIIYSIACLIMDQNLIYYGPEELAVIFITILALAIAVITTRKSIMRLYTDTDEANKMQGSL
ncbi:MAG TPA: hypothetical protein VIM79_21945 [Niastella sp.]